MTHAAHARLYPAAGALLALLVTAEASASDLYSVEKRDLMGRHELNAALGVLPIDAFYKGLTVRGAYAYHFNHLFGWEILGGLYSFNFKSDLKQRLKDDFDVQPTEVGELNWILDSSAIIRPLYGKLALLNDKLITGELYFALGYALGGFTAAYPSGFDAGAGLRVFISRYFSVRVDIRDYCFFPTLSNVQNHLYLSLGVSLTFGFSDETSEE